MSSHLLSDSSDLRGVKALEFGSVLSEADQDEAEANLLHARFASSLSRKGAFTFVPRPKIDRKFDEYCARDEMDDTKYPLVAVGGKGSGKSAAISNWADHRASAALLQNQQLREFIFLHHVGASRDSVELFHLLRRLMHAIQERFNLPVILQNTEEGLCRELPRLLKLAASRCNGVIILVDGIDKVMTIDGSRAGLKWLPFILPPKTRFILMATEEGDTWQRYLNWHQNNVGRHHGGGGGGGGMPSSSSYSNKNDDNDEAVMQPSNIMTEVARRGWETYKIDLLTEQEKIKIVDRFLDTPRNVHGHGTLHAHASFKLYREAMRRNSTSNKDGGGTFLTSVSASVDIEEEMSFHLRLFKEHVDQIVRHPLSTYPKYLKSVLLSLSFYSDHKFCINYCLGKMLQCKSFRELFSCQLGLWEDGFNPSNATIKAARNVANRSSLYEPDPKCQEDNMVSSDSLTEAVAHMNVKPEYLINNDNIKRPKSRVEALRAQTADSDNYSSDEFETSGVYSTDGFEDDDENMNESVGKRSAAVTFDGRQRTFHSPAMKAKGADFSEMSQSLHEEQAAVALQSVFRGFKSRKNIHKTVKENNSNKKLSERSKKSKSKVPQYLLGGNKVVGIADWLGQALAASFVSRIGLSVAELFDILEYIARDDLDDFFNQSGNDAITTPSKSNEADNDINGFNYNTKVALVRALDSIGVVATNGDIWLPLSEVHSRREVRNRYMKGDRGEYILSLTSDGVYTEDLEQLPSPTTRWRHHLIRFFKRLPPCKRQIQEVPYHLEGTGRWQGLKDILADLDTFRIKYTCGNRSRWELYRMWKTLSGVKLDDVAFSKHATSGVNLSQSWSSTKANTAEAVVDDSDDEISRGQFSIRRTSGVNAVKLPKATYDVVNEYNYAISQWYIVEEPHAGKLCWTLEKLSEFFLNFGDFEDEMNLPEYLVPHLDERMLASIGFEMWPPHLKDVVKRPAHAPKESGQGRPPAANAVKKRRRKKKKKGTTPVKSETKVGFRGIEDEEESTGEAPKVSEDLLENGKKEIINDDLDYKLYRRWVWIMFPWLALSNADGVVPPRTPGLDGIVGKTPGFKKKSFWEVKKIDPNGAPKINVTPIQLKSQLNAEKKLLENAVASPAILRAREIAKKNGNRASHEDAYKTAMGRVKGKRKPTREEALQNIPFSSPSTKSLRTGTRFPTVEKMERDDPSRRMVLFSTGIVSKDHVENTASSLIKVLPPSHEFDSGSVKHLAAHSQDYPATERDANVAGLNQMIARLREELDCLMYEREEKQKALDQLNKKVGTRRFMDDYTRECIEAGEAMIAVLKERIKKLKDALSDGARLGKFYTKVMNVCQKFPARDEPHLKKVERRLKVSDSRASYLKARQQAAKYEYTHLLTVEKPALEIEAKKADLMMTEAVKRLKDIRRRMQREQEKEIAREKKRELTRNAIVQQDIDKRKKMAAANVLSMLGHSAMKTKLQESKVQEAEYEGAFARIKSATGISDPNMVFIKFINKDQVYTSLEEQRQKYENRILALEKRSNELNRTLLSLQNANTFISSRHIREVDDQTFVSESRLHTERVRWNHAQQLLKDVHGGTMHLSRMIGVNNKREIRDIDSDLSKKRHVESVDPKLLGKDIERRLADIERHLVNLLKSLPNEESMKKKIADPNYVPSSRPMSQSSSTGRLSPNNINSLRYEIRVPSRQSQIDQEEEALEEALDEIALLDEDEMIAQDKVRDEIKSREKEVVRSRRRELANTQ